LDSIIDLGDIQPDIYEQLGTKPKFWFEHPVFGKCLCKSVRPDTGEDWSEVVAAGIAERLGLPHAEYKYARYKGQRAVLTPTILPDLTALILGNELLTHLDPTYKEGVQSSTQVAHTVHLVMQLLDHVRAPKTSNSYPTPVGSAADVFAGYLAFDALIGNTDRHHANWGIVIGPEAEVRLAPTFDHASSLGCHENDDRRALRLVGKDRNFTVASFASKAGSGFYDDTALSKRVSTIDAFATACAMRTTVAQGWLDRIASLAEEDFVELIAKVPTPLISETARLFAVELLKENQRRLAALRE